MKRILVANDLSQRSSNALARAIGLAARHGAEIRIVHAADALEDPDAHHAAHRRVITEARIMAEELTDRTIEFTARISSTGPGHAIVREAAAFDADLVVLGAHGRPRFRDAVFGTTGSYVVRHCSCPILVVQNDACESYAKTLIAIEEVADASILFSHALAVAPATEVFAVHAFDPSLREVLGGLEALDLEEVRQELELEKLLGANLAGRPRARFVATQHAIVETGEALEVITDETEALKPDLLVMGTRQRSILFDSHAVDALYRCENDILIVPERASVTAAASA